MLEKISKNSTLSCVIKLYFERESLVWSVDLAAFLVVWSFSLLTFLKILSFIYLVKSNIFMRVRLQIFV